MASDVPMSLVREFDALMRSKPKIRPAEDDMEGSPRRKRYCLTLPTTSCADVGGGGGGDAIAVDGRVNRANWGLQGNDAPAGGSGDLGTAATTAAVEAMAVGDVEPRPCTPPHTFCQKTVVKLETCCACKKKMKFGKLVSKCSVCRIVCHQECRGSLHPCVPGAEGKVVSSGERRRGSNLDSPDVSGPLLLPLLRRCTEEIERRGLGVEGLYCASPNTREEREVREALGRGEWARLGDADPLAVAAALIAVLRCRPEPIVTDALAADFVKLGDVSASMDERRGLLEATVARLPAASRNALALLVLHLQRVAAAPRSAPVDKLAKAVAPALLGSPGGRDRPHMLLRETHKQAQAVLLMLNTPSAIWEQLLNDAEETELEMFASSTPQKKGRFGSPIWKLRSLRLKRPYFSPYH